MAAPRSPALRVWVQDVDQGMKLSGFGLRVSDCGFGFRVRVLGSGLGFWVMGLGFGIWGLGFEVSGF